MRNKYFPRRYEAYTKYFKYLYFINFITRDSLTVIFDTMVYAVKFMILYLILWLQKII